MNIVLWILQVLLAVAFFMAGIMKVTGSKDKLKERGGERMNWVDDFTDGQLKIIGGLEVLGAVGLILPALTGILPILTPIAAVGLVATMVGAGLTHLRRSEMPLLMTNAVLGLIAVVVAVGRFLIAPIA